MKYNRVDPKTGAQLPQIEDKVIIQIIHDDSPDTSYLDQEEFEDRKRQYEADQFTFIGVRVVIQRHNWLTGNTHSFKSAGLWGIESDCGEDYIRDTARDELATLQDEYPQLKGVTLDDAEITEQQLR